MKALRQNLHLLDISFYGLVFCFLSGVFYGLIEFSVMVVGILMIPGYHLALPCGLCGLKDLVYCSRRFCWRASRTSILVAVPTQKLLNISEHEIFVTVDIHP